MSHFLIAEREGYSPKVGVLVSQLESARRFLLAAVRELSVTELDDRPSGLSNSIAMIIAHVAATERFFQVMSFQDRQFNEEEKERWWPSFRFEKGVWNQGRDLASYFADLAEGRAETLRWLEQKDDDWLAEDQTFFNEASNRHYYWFHFLQDEVRHTGQITLMRKHLVSTSDVDFNPYYLV